MVRPPTVMVLVTFNVSASTRLYTSVPEPPWGAPHSMASCSSPSAVMLTLPLWDPANRRLPKVNEARSRSEPGCQGLTDSQPVGLHQRAFIPLRRSRRLQVTLLPERGYFSMTCAANRECEPQSVRDRYAYSQKVSHKDSQDTCGCDIKADHVVLI